MTNSIDEIDAVLSQTQPVSEYTSLDNLREWRGELVHTSVYVSYAISVLSLDQEILEQSHSATDPHDLQLLVDRLPQLLASGWVGGGWSLSPDAATSVQAADDLTKDYAEGLLGLHAELAASDLGDSKVVDSLEARVKEQRGALCQRRNELEERIRSIQGVMRDHYKSGTASIDDWLK
ncbi:MAG TPA: hypothetical protein VGG17_03170 [Acidimicrobiales bacterium]